MKGADVEIVETDDYRISPARYAKNKVAVFIKRKPDAWLKGRAERMCCAMPGSRYSHREHSFIMSKRSADRFHKLYQEGWDASFITHELIPPEET